MASTGASAFVVALAAMALWGADARADVNPNGDCWIDAQTGKPAPRVPESAVNYAGATVQGAGAAEFDPENSNRAVNSKTGRTFIRQPDGSWIDAQSGQPVPTAPESAANYGGATVQGTGAAQFDPENPNRAVNSKTGQTFIRVPCPQPAASEHAATPRAPSALEVAVLNEINAARTDPHTYAHRLRPAPYVDISDAAAFLTNHAPIPPLTEDPRLAGVAIAHEEEQGPEGGESHTGADGSSPGQRMRAAGVQTSEYAEIISVGYATAGGVVEQEVVDQPGRTTPTGTTRSTRTSRSLGSAAGRTRNSGACA